MNLLLTPVGALAVNAFFTSVGVTVLYMRWGRKRLRPYLLCDLLDPLGLSEAKRVWLEFCIFIVVGCVISLAMTHPRTAAQAIAAGLGWTGLVARPIDVLDGDGRVTDV